jgi:hypothetical protein
MGYQTQDQVGLACKKVKIVAHASAEGSKTIVQKSTKHKVQSSKFKRASKSYPSGLISGILS